MRKRCYLFILLLLSLSISSTWGANAKTNQTGISPPSQQVLRTNTISSQLIEKSGSLLRVPLPETTIPTETIDETLRTNIPPNGTTYPTSVTYNPNNDLYYVSQVIGPTVTFKEDGSILGSVTTSYTAGSHGRGIWFNTLENRLEGNYYANTTAHYSITLDANGLVSDETLIPGRTQPDLQPQGTYDEAENLIIFFNNTDKKIYRYNNDGTLYDSFSITIPEDAQLAEHCIAYTGISGQEYGVYDKLNKTVLLYNKNTQELSRKVILNTTFDCSVWGFSYANGYFFLTDLFDDTNPIVFFKYTNAIAGESTNVIGENDTIFYAVADGETFVKWYRKQNDGDWVTYNTTDTFLIENYDTVSQWHYIVESIKDGITDSTSIFTVQSKHAQTLNFPTLSEMNMTEADRDPAASSNSDSAIIYSTSDSNIATIVNGKIHPVTTGTVSIYADQVENETYWASEQKSQDLVIKSLGQTITFNALALGMVGNEDIAPGATASSNLLVTYTSSDENVATIIENKIHFVAAGECNIYADQIGNASYTAAAQDTQLLIVDAAYECASFVADSFVYNGNTHFRSDWGQINLTMDEAAVFGSVWNKVRLDLRSNFKITSQMFMGYNDDGADGAAFVIQPLSSNAGSAGGGLGYQDIEPSLAVEFDTYYNPWDPTTNDHIALIKNGSADTLAAHTEIVAAYDAGNIEYDNWHNVIIEWRAATQRFTVTFNSTTVIDTNIDLMSEIFNDQPYVFWGFTAATGGAHNIHALRILEYCVTNAPENAPAISIVDSISIDNQDGVAEIDFIVTDMESDISKISIDITSSNQGLIPNDSIDWSGIDTTKTLTVSPISTETGVSNIIISATDEDGINTIDTLVVTVHHYTTTITDIFPTDGEILYKDSLFTISATITTNDPMGIDSAIMVFGISQNALLDTVSLSAMIDTFSAPMLIDSAGSYYGKIISYTNDGKMTNSDTIEITCLSLSPQIIKTYPSQDTIFYLGDSLFIGVKASVAVGSIDTAFFIASFDGITSFTGQYLDSIAPGFYGLKGVTEGISEFYIMFGVIANNDTTYSDYFKYTTSCPSVDTTTALEATGVGAESFTAHWRSSADAEKYTLNVYKMVEGDSISVINIQSITDTFYLVDNLDPGTSYYYNVKVEMATSCMSDASNTISLTTGVFTQLEQVNIEPIISTKKGAIIVRTNIKVDVEIYYISGALVAQRTLYSDDRFDVQKGIHLVKVNGEVSKVVVE